MFETIFKQLGKPDIIISNYSWRYKKKVSLHVQKLRLMARNESVFLLVCNVFLNERIFLQPISTDDVLNESL